MFEILENYKHKGCFEFTLNDRLSIVCNAPRDKSGVYLIWDSTDSSNKKLIYIGRSGELKNGILKQRKDGIYGRLVKGKQFGYQRRKSWPMKMKELGMSALSIYWFDTEDDNPEEIEDRLLSEVVVKLNSLPDWNEQGPRNFYPNNLNFHKNGSNKK